MGLVIEPSAPNEPGFCELKFTPVGPIADTPAIQERARAARERHLKAGMKLSREAYIQHKKAVESPQPAPKKVTEPAKVEVDSNPFGDDDINF